MPSIRPDAVRLYTEVEICDLLHIPQPRFRFLRRRRLIPIVRLGYRSYRYDIVDMRNALNHLKAKVKRSRGMKIVQIGEHKMSWPIEIERIKPIAIGWQ